jgi:hypothetical protein
MIIPAEFSEEDGQLRLWILPNGPRLIRGTSERFADVAKVAGLLNLFFHRGTPR